MKLALWHVLAAALVGAASAAPERRGAFDYAAHLGNLSPYQSAPVPSGMKTTLPDDCTVDQVMLVRRVSSVLSCARVSSSPIPSPLPSHGWQERVR